MISNRAPRALADNGRPGSSQDRGDFPRYGRHTKTMTHYNKPNCKSLYLVAIGFFLPSFVAQVGVISPLIRVGPSFDFDIRPMFGRHLSILRRFCPSPTLSAQFWISVVWSAGQTLFQPKAGGVTTMTPQMVSLAGN